VILYCLAGIIAGTITGLTPGIHTNNIAIMLGGIPFFGKEITVFILSMCITQTFVDFIPAVFLGAPDTETFEGVLPGHKLFLEGEAFQAICLTVFGGLIAIIAGIILTPIFWIFLEQNKTDLTFVIPIVLVFALVVLTIGENGSTKKILAIFAIIAAATQGFLFQEYIFALIVGYFGIPTILYSLKNTPKNVIQKEVVNIEKNSFIEGLIGVFGGAIVAIMPGIGSNVAAGIIRIFREKIKPTNYLVLLGSINTSGFFFSYTVLFVLMKARNGAMIILKESAILTPNTFLSGIGAMLIAGGAGGIITILVSKKMVKFFSEKKILFFSIISLIVMIFTVIAFNGVMGVIVLLFSGALGMFVIIKKIKRSCCMGSLIVPTLFFYLFILY
jgi:putative membrane protein